MSRPTFAQQDALVNFLEQNPGIAKGSLRTAHAKQDTKRKWNQISPSINALGGARKDGRGWAKYWADKKCALKKMCLRHAISRTGGGPVEDLPSLTPLDQRLVAVVGGPEFAIDDSNVAINPTNTAPSPAISDQDTKLDMEIPSLEDAQEVKGNFRNVKVSVLRLDSAMKNADSMTVNVTPHDSQGERSPLLTPRANRRCSLSRRSSNASLDRQIFADIHMKRVEAEAMTATGLNEAADNIAAVASAINNLAAAVTEAAHVIAQAMSAAGSPQQ